MPKDRRRDRKRQKKLAQKLAEKKRKANLAESLAYMGSKYQTEKLAPTWMHTEVGIYETYVMTDRKLVDETVYSSIEALIRKMRAGTLPPLADTDETHYEVGREEDLLIENIRRSWANRFTTESKPSKDKLIGVLRSILGSIKKVKSPGPRSQSYLQHIAGFLTKKLGVSVKAFPLIGSRCLNRKRTCLCDSDANGMWMATEKQGSRFLNSSAIYGEADRLAE